MALIAMIYILLDTQLLQSQDTSDTEKYLLLQSVFPVTTVKAVSDWPVKFRVEFIIGIQQIKTDTTDIGTPYISMNLIIGIGNINYHRITVFIKHTLYRK